MGSCVIIQERSDKKWVYQRCHSLLAEVDSPFLASRHAFDTVEEAIAQCRDIAITTDEGIHIVYYNGPAEEPQTFQQELRSILNKHSKENGSDTPDYILAEFLKNCLRAYDTATVMRTAHYAPKES